MVQFRLAAPLQFMADLYELLAELQIPYVEHQHPAFFSIGDADAYLVEHPIPGASAKSLFLRNNKGDQHYMVVIAGEKRLDVKALETSLGETKMSFASPDRMMKYLGITPGSVSPFALINDLEKHVKVILDADVFAEEQVQFHPLINTATLVLAPNDVKKFIEATGHHWQEIKL